MQGHMLILLRHLRERFHFEMQHRTEIDNHRSLAVKTRMKATEHATNQSFYLQLARGLNILAYPILELSTLTHILGEPIDFLSQSSHNESNNFLHFPTSPAHAIILRKNLIMVISSLIVPICIHSHHEWFSLCACMPCCRIIPEFFFRNESSTFKIRTTWKGVLGCRFPFRTVLFE